MGQINAITTLPPRRNDSYKNNFGRVLIVAGSAGMSGAISLAGKAALRSGAGLVELLCPQSIWQMVAAAEPCYMAYPLPEDSKGRISDKAIETILERVQNADIVAVGPGLGQSEQLIELICSLLNCEQLPLIIDADGLNNLTRIPDWHDMASANLILTPHPGEMQRLCKSIPQFELSPDREDLAIEFLNETGSIVVLKGAGTVVACGEDYYVNTTGNPGMATAGSGDVLTGILAALLGQFSLLEEEISPQQAAFEAAILATYIHGKAGDIAAEKYGQTPLIASDIINCLPLAFKSVNV